MAIACTTRENCPGLEKEAMPVHNVAHFVLLIMLLTHVTGNMEEVLGGFFHTLGGENHFMSSRRLP